MGTDNNNEIFYGALMGTSSCATYAPIRKLDWARTCLNDMDVKKWQEVTNVFNETVDRVCKAQREQAVLETVRKMLVPKRILRSGNRTIVFWEDGSKTIVKLCEDCEDNPYDAFTAALAKKIFGTNSALKRMIAKKLEYR